MSYPDSLSQRAAATRRRSSLASQCGLTLVESLVAITIVAMGAASVGGLLSHQVRQAASNQLATKAYALAAEELEQMRGLPFAAMSATSHDESVGSVVFRVATTVAAGVPANNMKKVTVKVSWDGPEGTRNVTISTVYTAVQRS